MEIRDKVSRGENYDLKKNTGGREASVSAAPGDSRPEDEFKPSEQLKKEAEKPEENDSAKPVNPIGAFFDGIARGVSSIVDGVKNAIGGIVEGVRSFFFGEVKKEPEGEDSLVHPDVDPETNKNRVTTMDNDDETAVSEKDDSVIFVNGAGTTREEAEAVAGKLSTGLGREVDLIHNATSAAISNGGILGGAFNAASRFQGFQQDLQQVDDDIKGKGTNESITAVREEVRRRLEKGLDVDLVGHSQGTLIISEALNQLKAEYGEKWKDYAEKIHVLSMGGADSEFYPEGIFLETAALEGDLIAQSLAQRSPDELRGENVPALVNSAFIEMLRNGTLGAHDPNRIMDQTGFESITGFLGTNDRQFINNPIDIAA